MHSRDAALVVPLEVADEEADAVPLMLAVALGPDALALAVAVAFVS